jgi:hypothetical protein
MGSTADKITGVTNETVGKAKQGMAEPQVPTSFRSKTQPKRPKAPRRRRLVT